MKNNAALWALVACFVIMAVIVVHYNPVVYKAPWALIRFLEISAILLFSNYVSKVDFHDVLSVAHARIMKGHFGSIDSKMMNVIDNILVYEYTGFIYAALAALFFYKRFNRETFDKSLNFDELLGELSRHFRFARCMIALDPTKDVKTLDFSKGPFALKMEIIPYLEKHAAIGRFRVSPTADESRYMIRDKADSALIRTLGRRFKSVDDLNYYERWLFAAFCLKLKSKKYGADQPFKDAETLLGDISYHLNGEGNLKRANAITKAAIAKYRNDPEIVGYCNKHAFVSGVLKELFHRAKSRGVHPCFHFTWLFTVDRTLMLVLEETGMPDERGGIPEISAPESGIECLYPRLHWTNENKQGVRLFEPACSYILDYIEQTLVKNYDFMTEADSLAIISEQAKRTAAANEVDANGQVDGRTG